VAHFAQTAASLSKNLIATLVFEKKPTIVFAEDW
jgi:hypothetical protein